jgi:hypothetical protein
MMEAMEEETPSFGERGGIRLTHRAERVGAKRGDRGDGRETEYSWRSSSREGRPAWWMDSHRRGPHSREGARARQAQCAEMRQQRILPEASSSFSSTVPGYPPLDNPVNAAPCYTACAAAWNRVTNPMSAKSSFRSHSPRPLFLPHALIRRQWQPALMCHTAHKALNCGPYPGREEGHSGHTRVARARARREAHSSREK